MTGKRNNPNFRKLLVGYDGSRESDKAIDVTLSLAKSMDSSVLVFALTRLPEPSTSAEVEAVLDDHFEQGFEKIRQKAKAVEIEVRTATAVGHSAGQIIHRAEEDGIDLVILGRRGRSLISRMRLGSVSERTLRYDHCPVTVVH